MKPINGSERRKKILGFSLILLATAALVILILSMLGQGEASAPEVREQGTTLAAETPQWHKVLLSGSNILTAHITALQRLDEDYRRSLTDSNDKEKLDSINKMIHLEEVSFRGSIDSVLLNMPVYADSSVNTLFSGVLSSYQALLGNHIFISGLRNAITPGKTHIPPDEMALLKAQKELQEKESRIASLELSLKNSSLKIVNPRPPGRNDSTENITALRNNLIDQQNKVAALSRANNSLKQDNDRLLKQTSDASKNTANSELFFKNKSATLQQKVDALSAELSLAQVDCNLSRVDAGQIISTSKQRKQLLSEASGILTGLANSGDVAIKKKVQDKIAHLNEVAAHSRE